MKMKDFVRDQFFERSHWKLKIIQLVSAILMWLVLFLPMLILLNSRVRGGIVHGFFHLSNVIIYDYTNQLAITAVLLLLGSAVISLVFLLRNNYFVKQVYPKQKTYDPEKNQARTQILEAMYAERFMDQASRERVKYYVVAPEQNLPNGMVEKIFIEKKVEVEK